MDYEKVICGNKEMSVREEIEHLDIPQETKDRILKKLKEVDCNFSKRIAQKENEYCEKIAKEIERFNGINKQNLALKNACFALSDALKQETTIK